LWKHCATRRSTLFGTSDVNADNRIHMGISQELDQLAVGETIKIEGEEVLKIANRPPLFLVR
jgi:hypothetical protein